MRARPVLPWLVPDCAVAAAAAAMLACGPPPKQPARAPSDHLAPMASPAPPAAAAPSARPPKTLTPADIAEHALPAIVTIRTQDSLGTGFVVRPDGWIATNLHVVVGATHAKVTLRNSREFDVVEVLAVSPEHDLALLRVDAHGLPVLALGDSDAMRPGDPIVAIGNPLGLEDTVSNGLVSARRKGEDGSEVLQISAPIAPGSSGGPIFNERGEVVGIAVAILEEGQNLNFGVPVRYLAPLIRRPSPISFARFTKLVARLREDAGAPKVQRNVPHHPVSILDGCSDNAQRLIAQMIQDAVQVGAPLYNEGKPGACYHVYDGAASDLVRRLPSSCRGPARALGEAQRHAGALGDVTAQAWAMRDAFDGLMDVIERKHQKGR